MSDELVARLRAAGCVYAEDEARLLAEHASGADLDALVGRRAAGEPLEHLLGWVEFSGLRLSVGPGVFVPRARSVVLVSAALHHLRDVAVPVVVELCCGVAPIGAAVLAERPDVQVHASDIDVAALVHARRNLGPAAHVRQGDLFAAVPRALRRRVDVLVANAPYVPTAELAFMPAEARDHEPRQTLDGGADGVALHRRIADGAEPWLAADGVVVVETGRAQAAQTCAALSAAGLVPEVWADDEVDGTAVVARRPR